MAQPSDDKLLAHIGRDYYLENKSKVEIATAYGISRFQVARLLEEARARGIVRIEVAFPHATSAVDTSALQRNLGIESVIVTATGSDDSQTRDGMAEAAAEQLMKRTRKGATVGISWSRALDLAARRVTELPDCDLVQLAGALPVPGSRSSIDLIRTLGEVTQGKTWPIWAPLVVENAATAESLKRQPEISQALVKADSLDLAVVALGGWRAGISTVWDRVDNATRLAGVDAGAVAECSGRLISADGQPVRTALDECVIAVTLEQLRQTPHVVVVAQGAARADAVHAAIRAGIVGTLIIDEELAWALEEPLHTKSVPSA
ncbi:sugar-binding domain-containing protein [Crystallibacter degradans]|uniref:sugar-binding domain-containing protein n=1 Tax=Crystallibacter degradans TaxID=2726743 RepID=UPI0014740ADC|nr:Cro/Cl family transcriptional regulator [Arthrobacter sp. SF27]